MIKHKKKNLKAVYLKFFSSLLTVLIVLILAETKAFAHFKTFVGGNALLSLLLGCLVLLPSATGLAYGILLSEYKPDVTKLRLGVLIIAILLASLIAYSWAYLFVNGIYS